MSVTDADVKRSKTICRIGCSKSNIFAETVGYVIFSICELIFFCFFIKPNEEYMYSDAYDLENIKKYAFLALAIIFLICGILILIRIHSLKKSFICLTELGVYGSGGKCCYLSSHPFTLPYDQITDIFCKNDSVCIESGGIKYICIVKKAKEVTMGIQAEVSMHKN